MKSLTQQSLVSRRQGSPRRLALASLTMALAAMLSGCGGSANIPASTASGPQLYMSATIFGPAGGSAGGVATYSINDTTSPATFWQDTYSFAGAQSGPQLNYSGDLTALSRGLWELDLAYDICANTSGGCALQTYSPALARSGWAVELAGQDGGLLQLIGPSGSANPGLPPFVPLVPAVTCPSMSSAEKFLFVTLPSRLITSGTDQDRWNPLLETAYGSVAISASGSTVTLSSITQNILPSAGGGTVTGAPTSATGDCSSTVYGNTVAVPANPTIITPGSGNPTVSPQAMMGIGPSGLLVEDNGSGPSAPPYYENSLGAGTGAIGLPEPSSPVDTSSDTSSLLNAQYLGFFYGTGNEQAAFSNGFSTVASFGFPNPSTSCSTLMAQISAQSSTPLVNPIYGGDFPENTTTGFPDPSLPSVQANGGFGNCDFAIALGAQSSTNGIFPNAMVYVGPTFGGNTNTTRTAVYSFPAVAIAGQLNSKYAIFLIGEDTAGTPNQAWGIYLLQSN